MTTSRALALSALISVVMTLVPGPGETSSGGTTTARSETISRLEAIPDRYIVLLRENGFRSSASIAAEVDRRSGTEIDQIYDTAFAGFAGEFTSEAALGLLEDPAVAGVFPDLKVHVQGQSLEPGIDRVDADYNPTRAGNGAGSVDVDVAVIDTGVGPNNDVDMVGGYDCLNQGSLRDYYGHGTHVAGIIGARDNDFGVVGVAPGARIWSVRVLDQYGNGSLAKVICGMEWVAERGDTIDVANMSLGLDVYDAGSGCTSSLVHRAVCAMTNAGVTVMAAACNSGIDAITCSPGRYPEVISVSAFAEWDGKPGGQGGCKSTPDGFYGCDDRRASFSNYGATVDIAAIGVGVYSTLFDNRYGYWSGTSMATPHVTGAAALLIAQEGDMSPARVRARLLLSAMSGPVPGDPDAYPEPILNVASLGEGTLTVPQSARPGQEIRLRVGEIIPRTVAVFSLNGSEIGRSMVTANGNAYLTYRLPDLPYGKYEIVVTNHRKTLRERVLVRPSVVLSDREARVGDTVSVVLRGYGSRESILISMDTGSGERSLVRVRAGADGSAGATFTLPSSTAGFHRVAATDESGHTTYATVKTLPSMTAPGSAMAGEWMSVSLRGFSGGETVDLRWGSSTGPVLRTKITTPTGSGDVNVLLPADATDGPHSLWAVGSAGNRVRVTVTTFGSAVDPTPLPTVTAQATASPTAVEPTETPPVITVTPSPVESSPTADATITDTPTATASATLADPGETATESPPTESRDPETDQTPGN